MKSAERVLAQNHPEEAGHSLSLLQKTYTAAAMFVYCLDDFSAPLLTKRLTKRTLSMAEEENWTDGVKQKLPDLVRLAMAEGRQGRGFGLTGRAAAIGVPERTWSRNYARPYEAIYQLFMGWVFVGRAHVFRRVNG